MRVKGEVLFVLEKEEGLGGGSWVGNGRRSGKEKAGRAGGRERRGGFGLGREGQGRVESATDFFILIFIFFLFGRFDLGDTLLSNQAFIHSFSLFFSSKFEIRNVNSPSKNP